MFIIPFHDQLKPDINEHSCMEHVFQLGGVSVMKKFRIKNLDCASCALRIEKGVGKLDDVKFVSVNFATASFIVDTSNLELVKQKIKEIEPDAELEEFSSSPNF
jgi:copper chaperone CopZ